jgi:triosephosphate isomerase (TIM)
MRTKFVAGNWKMNMNKTSGPALAQGIAKQTADAASKVDIAVFPPFVYITAVVQALAGSKIAVGGQDVYFVPQEEKSGAFTGEISVAMLKDVACQYVLIGHSERRHILKEDDTMIQKKVAAVLKGGLLPMLCIGELLEERRAGKTMQVVSEQVQAGLSGVTSEDIKKVTLAYEPVWAIGTGETATPAQAQEVHAMIRKLIEKLYDKKTADNMRILYGGSVKPNNAAELMGQPDIDGALVGGASLKVEDFVGIVKAAL